MKPGWSCAVSRALSWLVATPTHELLLSDVTDDDVMLAFNVTVTSQAPADIWHTQTHTVRHHDVTNEGWRESLVIKWVFKLLRSTVRHVGYAVFCDRGNAETGINVSLRYKKTQSIRQLHLAFSLQLPFDWIISSIFIMGEVLTYLLTYLHAQIDRLTS